MKLFHSILRRAFSQKDEGQIQNLRLKEVA